MFKTNSKKARYAYMENRTQENWIAFCDAKRLCLTGITCTSHQLRHYFATLCFDAELKEKDVQEIMGHSKISLTHDVYTHIRKQRKEKSTEKLNAFLLAKERENSETSA